MAWIQCPKCQAMVSDVGGSCPKCGTKIQSVKAAATDAIPAPAKKEVSELFGVEAQSARQKPREARLATNLLWGSLGISVVIYALLFFRDVQDQFLLGALLSSSAVDVAVTALLVHRISQGRNWARIIFLIWFIFWALGLLVDLISHLNAPAVVARLDRSSLIGLLWAGRLLPQAVALYLVFSKPGATWFRREKTEKQIRPRRKLLLGCAGVLVLGLVAFLLPAFVVSETGRRKAEALYKAANNGTPLAEALEKHSGWFALRFGERPSDAETPRGHSDCGYAVHGEGKVVFHPSPVPEDPSQRERVYSSVRDFFSAESKVFTACPWVSALYSAFMFQSWTLSVQVDAQGNIIIAKEPRFYGD